MQDAMGKSCRALHALIVMHAADEQPGGSNDEPTRFPTYFPTAMPIDESKDDRAGFQTPLFSEAEPVEQQQQQEVTMKPFHLRLFASKAEPNYDEEAVLRVTMEHLIHSFRLRLMNLQTVLALIVPHQAMPIPTQ